MNIVTTSLLLFILSEACRGTFAQIRGRCGLDKFRCENGDCISSKLLCDGRPDCSDSSDETPRECLKSEIICPKYAFRCAYGACVDGDVTCNGIMDCADNSDETLKHCGTVTISNDTSSSIECSVNQLKCDNGQCIDSTALCDGIVDCTDGSDETFTKCGSFNCPQLIFRCTYGACIDGDLKCNGVINCADGSDEDPKLCADLTSTTAKATTTTRTPVKSTWPTISQTWKTTASPTSTSTTAWTPKPTPKRFCVVPPQPANGYWKLHKSLCPNDQDCDVSQGTELEPGAYLIYTCNFGYKIEGSKEVFCGSGGEWLNIPTCEEIRCKPLSSASVDAQCTYNDEWVSCESSVRPRTKARLICRNSYRQDTTFLSRQRDRVTCNEKGQWEPDPIRCVPVCGVASNVNGRPLIVNGSQPAISEFPWHATLYKSNSNQEKEFVCGATIIQENLLVTAAHCVYDESNKRVFNPSSYYVATGNIFRDYDSPLHDPNIVKKSQVKNIYVICNYLGLEGNYAWDIAILEIAKPFVFSALLLPACLDTSTQGDQTVLEPGSYGRVAGFGRTSEGPSSYILQSLQVPYIPHNQCKSSAPESERYITIDKFCAGYTNGSSVCDGDSGGGLVFKTRELWYLRGIVSVGLGAILSGASRICDSHSYSLYTRLSNHIAWIQDVILKLDVYKSYPSCNTPQVFRKL